MKSNTPLHADSEVSDLQYTTEYHCTGRGTVVSPPTGDTKDSKAIVGEAEAVDDRCSRQCTLVNVADSKNCSSTASTAADWMMAAHVVDRICFIVLSVGLVAGTLTVSLMATLDG